MAYLVCRTAINHAVENPSLLYLLRNPGAYDRLRLDARDRLQVVPESRALRSALGPGKCGNAARAGNRRNDILESCQYFNQASLTVPAVPAVQASRAATRILRSEEHTSELQSQSNHL